MRQAIINDPNFNHGDYYEGTPPHQGLSIARMLGMLTYRTDLQLAKAFGRATKSDGQFWGSLSSGILSKLSRSKILRSF